MNRWLRNIDLRRYSGLSEALGIDVRTDCLRVTVLRIRRGRLNKFRASFQPLDHFEIPLGVNEDATAQGERLRKSLEERKIRTRHAVIGLSPSNARTVTTTVPASSSDIPQWIGENIQRLLRLPIPTNEVVIGYERLHDSPQGKSIEVTVARKKDIEELYKLISAAAINVLGISLSSREALTALLASGHTLLPGNVEFKYYDQNMAHVSYLSSGKRTKTGLDQAWAPDQSGPNRNSTRNQSTPTEDRSVVAGELPANLVIEQSMIVSPFGLPTIFTASAGLAVKAFLPELSALNLLDRPILETSEIRFAKSLFHRVTIGTGAILMLLLLLQAIASFAVAHRSNRVDEVLLSLGSSFIELKQLEQQVAELRAATEGPSAVVGRSRYSELLHEVAASAPEGLWLRKLILEEGKPGPDRLTLEGYARTNDLIAAFLKNLKNNSVCREVRLTRSGSGSGRNSALPVNLAGKGFVTFVIEGVTQS